MSQTMFVFTLKQRVPDLPDRRKQTQSHFSCPHNRFSFHSQHYAQNTTIPLCTSQYLVLVYKYLTTGQPKYFAPYLPLYKSAVNTRRSNPKNLFLLVPSYCPSIHKSKVHFNNSFSYDAPKLWNDLPYDIRSAPNLSSFKSRLKTYLFQKSFPP